MKKSISIHIIGTILYLGAFLYISEGIDLEPKDKIANVVFLTLLNLGIGSYCSIWDINKKNSR
jgi:hypothetical protein